MHSQARPKWLRCLFLLSTAYLHNSQPFTGEIKVALLQRFAYVCMVMNRCFMFSTLLFFSPLSDTCVIEKKSQTATSCMCDRLSEAERRNLRGKPEDDVIQEKASPLKTSKSRILMSLGSLPTYLWASRPWCETQQWMGLDWDWDWGSDWDCGCRGWGCCCCLHCGCCCCHPPDWPYRWWHS